MEKSKFRNHYFGKKQRDVQSNKTGKLRVKKLKNGKIPPKQGVTISHIFDFYIFNISLRLQKPKMKSILNTERIQIIPFCHRRMINHFLMLLLMGTSV